LREYTFLIKKEIGFKCLFPFIFLRFIQFSFSQITDFEIDMQQNDIDFETTLNL